jgi:glutamine cyclotransferase
MKKTVLILLILGLIGGLVVVPMFSNKEITEPVKFAFSDNLATQWNTIIPVGFLVESDEVKKVEIYFEDSLVKIIKEPKDKNTFQLNAGYFGLGTRKLKLVAYLEDGSKYEDERLVRILSDTQPANWKLVIEQTFPHNKTNFTQGLEFDEQVLFEATGDPNNQGATLVGPINLLTGEHIKKIGLDANYFGEGITILNNKIFQLTYTEGKCFVYDKSTLQLIQEFTYAGEGWGLCNDGAYLYMSDGTERITKRRADTFEVVETIEVYDNQGPIRKLNELEFVDGIIFANVWMTEAIVAFQPENGKLLAVMDARELVAKGANGGDVLNGIAYDKQSKSFYMTGKYWDKIFRVSILK